MVLLIYEVSEHPSHRPAAEPVLEPEKWLLTKHRPTRNSCHLTKY